MKTNRCVNHEYDAECFAVFAKEADSGEVILQIAEFGEDLEIIVENTEGSVQYVLDRNNHFQVTEIDEDNILNEIVDVLEKSDLYLPNMASPAKFPSKMIKNLDPFLEVIEDYTNNNDVDHLIDHNFVPLDFNQEDLSSYLKSLEISTDNISTPIDKLKTEAIVVLEDCCITKRFEDTVIASCFEQTIEYGKIIEIEDSNEYFEDIVYQNAEDVNENGEIIYNDDNKENVEEIIYTEIKTEIRRKDVVVRSEPSLRSVRKKILTCKTCQFVAHTKELLIKHEKQHAPKKSVHNTKKALPKKSVCNTKNALPKKSVCNTKNASPKKSVCNTKNALPKKSVCNTKNASPKKSVCNKKNALPKKSVCNMKNTLPKKSVYNTKNASLKIIREYTCRFCDASFPYRSVYERHHLSCFKKFTKNKKTCPLCRKIFHDIYAYEIHLIYHENRKYMD